MTGGILTRLAKDAADEYIRHQQVLALPDNLPFELLRQAACYVSIFENPGRHFRSGCGSPLPRQASLAQEIIMNTVQAVAESATSPFRQVDLGYLVYAVSIVGPLERITGAHSLLPETHGLYLRSDKGKSAILLPGRVGIETGDDQLATAYRESGIDTRQEAVSLYRFSVTEYS